MSPAQLIDERIDELDDWRGETLSRLRALVKQADPDIVEEWTWRGVPAWCFAQLLEREWNGFVAPPDDAL